ncbi:MAG: Tol-Pal system beta propeller repeat protein TolB [Deltaproteobacteria bacterium]|nr:Tol-Pal system beta propeller repeat protein TolB [Deltaproteobacteria bacterium]
MKISRAVFYILIWGIFSLFIPSDSLARIYLDINAPSIERIKVAIPDFKDLSKKKENPEFAQALPEVLSHDLDMSGYFLSMDKTAFLTKDIPEKTEDIRFRDWSVIGAELLVVAKYTTFGRSFELEVRLYDVYRGSLIMGKRFLGKSKDYREVMHRIGNEIIYRLTGHRGIFLTKMAFVGTATGRKEIYISDYDGHNVRRITRDNSIALSPRWSPKGKHILYNSYKDGGPMLYMKNMSSGAVKRLSARKGLNIGASWTPNGNSIVLTLSHRGNPDIYHIDLTGKIKSRLVDHWGIDVSPTFSPDGKKIAFVSNRSGSPQIYVRDLEKNQEERVTFSGKYNTSPTWSSMNRIAYSGMNEGHFDIFTIKADGSHLRQLTDKNGKNEDPCWSPDGRYIVFSSNRDGRYHLYIMTANGQNQRKITHLKGDQTSPSWASF